MNYLQENVELALEIEKLVKNKLNEGAEVAANSVAPEAVIPEDSEEESK